MKIKHQLSIATLLMAGVFVTGCSSQSQNEGASQVSGSQQQVEGAAPVVAEPIMAPKAAPPVKMAPKPMMKPKPRVNRWTHTHPAIPRCTKSVRHTHKYSQARHTHRYSCQRPAKRMMQKKPQVDVRALQMKLRAKGYYKGPIDGIVGPGTRSALQRFMKR